MRAAAIVLMLACSVSQAETIKGTVMRVIDGDTLVVYRAGGARHVRLAKIDAPEMRQPHGPEAKAALEALTLRREVTVDGKPNDKYGRMLGEVFVDGLSVNQAMIRSGMAWAYRSASKPADRAATALQDQAKASRLGLWSKPAIEPGLWRKGQR